MNSISRNSTNRSYYNDSSQHQRKNKTCGLTLAAIFIIGVIIAVSITVVHINNTESTNETMPTPPPIIIRPPSSPTEVVDTTTTPSSAPTTIGYQACNGYETLCDVRANMVLYATLHNAVATQQDNVTILPNHELQLETALQFGWRGINFDIGICSDYTNQPIRLVHGTCQLGTRDPIEVFTNIQSFLVSKPNEVLLMPIQIDNSLDGTVSYSEIYSIMQQVNGFIDLLYQHPGVGTPWPTLRELITSNQRIMMFFYNGDTLCSALDDCPTGFHDWFVYAAETAFEFDTVEDIQNTDISCTITRGGQGARDFFGINLFTRIPSTSTSEQINAATFVKNHIETCSIINAPISPSLIIVDFWNIGNVEQVVSVYNGLLSTSTERVSANVTLDLLGNFPSIMNETDEVLFLSTCSNFFASQLTNLSNVYCSDTYDQMILSVRMRHDRRRQQQRHFRNLQDSNILQLTIQVQGNDKSDTDSSSLSSFDLEQAIGMSSTSFVQSLIIQSDYFSTVTEIRIPSSSSRSTTIFVPTNTPNQQRPTTMIPTSFPTSIDDVLDTTSLPTSSSTV